MFFFFFFYLFRKNAVHDETEEVVSAFLKASLSSGCSAGTGAQRDYRKASTGGLAGTLQQQTQGKAAKNAASSAGVRPELKRNFSSGRGLRPLVVLLARQLRRSSGWKGNHAEDADSPVYKYFLRWISSWWPEVGPSLSEGEYC